MLRANNGWNPKWILRSVVGTLYVFATAYNLEHIGTRWNLPRNLQSLVGALDAFATVPAGTRRNLWRNPHSLVGRLYAFATVYNMEPAGTRGGTRTVWWVRSTRLLRFYIMEPAGTRRNPRRNPHFFKDALRKTQISCLTP